MPEDHRSGLQPDDYHKLTGFEGDWRDTWWDSAYLAFMGGQLGLGALSRALDLGCGVGHWGQRLAPLLAADAHLTGIDAEAAWMEEAAGRARDRGLNATYRVADASALPFDDGSFDLVTCQTLLMHVPDAAVVIAEARRVLRPGGLLLAAEPNNFGSSAAHLMWEPNTPWEHIVPLLELELVCARGKEALGEGWSNVGERLPGLLDAAGFSGVGVRLNNQCIPRIPPYAADRHSIALERDIRQAGGVLAAGGTPENGLRFFEAGGGTPERFAELWDIAAAYCDARLTAVDNGTARGAGGHLHYLVWGRA